MAQEIGDETRVSSDWSERDVWERLLQNILGQI